MSTPSAHEIEIPSRIGDLVSATAGQSAAWYAARQIVSASGPRRLRRLDPRCCGTWYCGRSEGIVAVRRSRSELEMVDNSRCEVSHAANVANSGKDPDFQSVSRVDRIGNRDGGPARPISPREPGFTS